MFFLQILKKYACILIINLVPLLNKNLYMRSYLDIVILDVVKNK